MIEVRGVNFGNRGAQLMLIAIVRHFAEHGDFNLSVDHNVGSYEERALLGLYQKIWFNRFGASGGVFGRFVPTKLRRMYGLVTEQEIEAVLDASGFAYTDQWGPCRCRLAAKLYERYRRQGKKVILLPQAFGPFENEATRSAFKTVLDNTDLVFARDPVSYEHAKSVGGAAPHIRLSPDFTSPVKGVMPDYFEPAPRQACIIPNARMLDKTSGDARESYLPFLERCISLLISKSMSPIVLIHESGDETIALRLESDAVRVIREPDPVRLKGILGACEVVIGSRFHGLVSALSQGVPCLAAGWSHKYTMLLEEYGCPECLISPDDPEELLSDKLDLVANAPSRNAIIERLREADGAQRQQTVEMWEEVHHVLCGKSPG